MLAAAYFIPVCDIQSSVPFVNVGFMIVKIYSLFSFLGRDTQV